jgi:hypothetical protein
MDAPIFSSIKKFKDPLGFHRVKVYNDEQIIKYVLSLRIKAQKKEQDSLYLVCGLEGSGKSLFTLLSYHLYSELKEEQSEINNVTRNVDELMTRYSVLQRNSFVSLDEAQELASDRWNEKKSKEIKEKFTVMRKRAFISMICYPNPLKVSIYFREDRIRGVFFIKRPGCAYYYANSPENPHFTDILESWDKYNKTRSLKKFTRYAPDFIVYYPEYVGDLRVAYDDRKEENISTVLDKNVGKDRKPENYVSYKEACLMLDKTARQFQGYITRGKFSVCLYGANKYIAREELEKYINDRKNSIRNRNDANIIKG